MPIKLAELLDQPTIDLDLDATSKEDVLAKLVQVLERAGKVPEDNSLLESLIEREGLGSTGIGHGVAIPHARSDQVKSFAVAMARTRDNIDFDAVDGQPTRLFFLLVAPENGGNDHLFLLAKIARIVKDAKTRERLMAVDSSADVLELIRQQDHR